MGSGREAAMTSRLCGVFLKKMLLAGNSKPVAMEMLNNFIRSKNTECFSTVDLLEIDLLNGRASFIKSGAVASYVKRGEQIFRISSNTMPVGITKEINAEEVTFELEDGDVIVMVSDGVGQSKEDTVMVSIYNESIMKAKKTASIALSKLFFVFIQYYFKSMISLSGKISYVIKPFLDAYSDIFPPRQSISGNLLFT